MKGLGLVLHRSPGERVALRHVSSDEVWLEYTRDGGLRFVGSGDRWKMADQVVVTHASGHRLRIEFLRDGAMRFVDPRLAFEIVREELLARRKGGTDAVA